jgi:hypothetical protein
MTNYKDVKYQFPTSAITSGTFADARISSGSVTQHVTSTDLQPVKADITALALREATNEASAAFNLPNQFIETFTDDTNLGTQTTGGRLNGYWGTAQPNSLAKVYVGAKLYLSSAISNGIWKWQGSNDDITYTDLSSNFDWGGSAATTETTWSNTTAYRYIKVTAVSGSASGGPYQQETEFKVTTGGVSAYETGDRTSAYTVTVNGTMGGAQTPTVSVDGNLTNNDTNSWYWSTVSNSGYWVKWATGDNASFNATGTLIQSANTVASAKTVVGGTMLYKDNAGTATLGTDLKIYFSCNNGGAWTEAASYNAITPVYSTGIKQVRLGETTCTSGTGVIYKAVWANQVESSKETQLHGIGVNY